MAEGVDASVPIGWCDFEDVYRHWVRALPDDAVVVEVGSYLGQSAIAWGHAARQRGKRTRLVCVDPWKGVDERYITSPEFLAEQRRILRDYGGSMYAAFMHNLAAYGLAEWVDARQLTSVEAAAQFADGTVDRVMIDGDHEAPSVRADLDAWWPKVKPGGDMVGHDDDWDSVHATVRSWAQDHGLTVYPLSRRCWRIAKPSPYTSWTVPAPIRTCLVAICSNERTIGRQTVESLLGVLSPVRVMAAMQARGFANIEARWYSAHPGVDTLREIAVLDALRGQFSHLLFLDADMGWPATLLADILKHHDAGIVSGLYHLKRWPHQPVAFQERTWNAKDGVWDYTYDEDASHAGVPGSDAPTFRPQELIGMGCALIPVSVFERLLRPWFAYQRNQKTGLNTITEDVWFCQQARAAEIPIHLDASIRCDHYGMRRINEVERWRAEHDVSYLERGIKPPTADEWLAATAQLVEAG